jgi:hypothetical protein
MDQAVSRLSHPSKARVYARFSPCGICDGQSDTGTSFSPSFSVFLSYYLHTHLSSARWIIGPLVAAVQRHSLPVDMNNNSSCLTTLVTDVIFNEWKLGSLTLLVSTNVT